MENTIDHFVKSAYACVHIDWRMYVDSRGHTSESRIGILENNSLLIPNFHRDFVAIKV